MRIAAADAGPSFDPDLIPRIRRGDPTALVAVYRAFSGELLALARRLTGSEADAEDVLHDLIVGLPDAMRTYDERGKLRGWLKQVVVRMCLMRLRAARRRREIGLDAVHQLSVRAASVGDFDDAIEIALRELSPAIRAVVVLRFFDGFSHREIADTLGISINASEARLSRGIVALRAAARDTHMIPLIPFLFHPSRQQLAAFAAGEECANRSGVARHLERCSECRRFVGFTRRFEKAAAALPAPAPSDELLARALADRAAGARVILPATIEPAREPLLARAAGVVAVIVVTAILGIWWTGRHVHGDFASGNELLLAGFVPGSAEAAPADRAAGAMMHRLRPLEVTYQRWFIDSATGRTTDAGKYDLRVAPADSRMWVLTSTWREIADQSDMQGARIWAESVTVADSGLAPASRVVHVKPYRRWAGIYIDQRFRNDSVVGQMALDEDPTRRPIARDLRRHRERFVASETLAPVYFMGVPLFPGAEFDLSVLGWAVVPNNVLVPMRMKVVGSERIETPAGTFDCWKFVIDVGQETHYHWVRKSDGLGVLTRRRMSDGRTRELILIREESNR